MNLQSDFRYVVKVVADFYRQMKLLNKSTKNLSERQNNLVTCRKSIAISMLHIYCSRDSLKSRTKGS